MITSVKVSAKTLLTSLLGLLIIVWLSIYLGSAYWIAYDLKRQLLQADVVSVEKLVPETLLQEFKAKKLIKKPHGAGAKYLKQVWPVVIKQQDLYKLLILQVDATRGKNSAWHFSDFPSRFRLTLGEENQQVWFEWQRQTWRTWQLVGLCFYNPQPLEELKSCESSKR